jgi:phage terminase small subunit
MEKLTDKQLRFIDEYLIDLNATAAYIRAGYSSKLANTNATKLLQNTTIAAEIKKRQKDTSTKLGITKEELIQDLIDIKNKNKDESPTIAIKAVEVLNKMNGFDAPEKIDHTTNGNDINPTTININIRKK